MADAAVRDVDEHIVRPQRAQLDRYYTVYGAHTAQALEEPTARALRARYERAAAEGDLPAGCTPESLARFVNTVGLGLAVQAGGGATRAELTDAVGTALGALFPRDGQ